MLKTAFAGLVARHGPMVWNVCRSVLLDAHAAEDAFQATFMILVKKAASIRRRETLASWLYGVARRVAVRARKTAVRRGELRWGQVAEMKASSMPDPSRHEEIEALHQELDRLPERYRAVLVLCHLEGRTHAEAARLLNCPAGTVSIRVSRARERLQRSPGAPGDRALCVCRASSGFRHGLGRSSRRAGRVDDQGRAFSGGRSQLGDRGGPDRSRPTYGRSFAVL